MAREPSRVENGRLVRGPKVKKKEIHNDGRIVWMSPPWWKDADNRWMPLAVIFVFLIFVWWPVTKEAPPAAAKPTATALPAIDAKIYTLRRTAMNYVRTEWDASSSVEELRELMGEPDKKDVVEGRTFWYYIITPGAYDRIYYLKAGRVDRWIEGPLTDKYRKAEATATKTVLREHMAALQEQKQATVQAKKEEEEANDQ